MTSTYVPRIMRAAVARKPSVAKHSGLRTVGAVGTLVTATEALAAAVAVVALDEARRYGTASRAAVKADTRSQRELSKAEAMLAFLMREETYAPYAITDNVDKWAATVLAAEEALTARQAEAHRDSLLSAYAVGLRDYWSSLVVFPSEADPEAHPTASAYSYAEAVTRRSVRRLTVHTRLSEWRVTGDPMHLPGTLAESLPLSGNRITYMYGQELTEANIDAPLDEYISNGAAVVFRANEYAEVEWEADRTRSAIDALRKEAFRMSRVAAMRATDIAPIDSEAVSQRQSRRKARRAKRREALAMHRPAKRGQTK